MNHTPTPAHDTRDNGSRDRDERHDLWKAIDAVHNDQKTMLRELRDFTTALEKDQKERRSLGWLKRPVWIATFAWVAIACAVVWAAYKSSNGG